VSKKLEFITSETELEEIIKSANEIIQELNVLIKTIEN
jgi:hypothetical protein